MVAHAEKIEAFIARWGPSGGGERSNYQLFLTELCALLDVGGPDPVVEIENRNAYVFERRIPARRIDGPTTSNFIDLYKRGCFVLEAKQSAKRQERLAELKQLGLELPDWSVGSGRSGGAQWDTMMLNRISPSLTLVISISSRRDPDCRKSVSPAPASFQTLGMVSVKPLLMRFRCCGPTSVVPFPSQTVYKSASRCILCNSFRRPWEA